MILYKYMPFSTGQSVLRDSTILFSRPEHFNDPFDLPSYPEEPSSDPASGLFSNIPAMVKNKAWAENSGVLSLTRTPVNALMWAHYAEHHHGVVLGIDAAKAGFTNVASNFIPAQFGSVVYASRREVSEFATRPETGLAVGATHYFPADHFEKLQRVFLRKPLYWSYEEEVRVIKCLRGTSAPISTTESGTFDVVTTPSRTLHLYKLPPGSIVELYVGIRADLAQAEALVSHARQEHPQLKAFECTLDTSTLSVGFEDYSSIISHPD
ncbi:DUF2971 domain-containing protein [Agrobacterium tumefaciens]|uniref:DUF2971 domain-containing protein n=1 Tax=Agrobacterium tumefaciens TaxID=358 RepID=UPI0015741032|nr:DUF2971 domain-containing protein [Agrobacterium tumefaciens]NTE53218.1 DUF2971 domain-containing protein [Agrobacterium tumefaciens]